MQTVLPQEIGRFRFEEAVKSAARSTAFSMGGGTRARRVSVLTCLRCVDEGGRARPLQVARPRASVGPAQESGAHRRASTGRQFGHRLMDLRGSGVSPAGVSRSVFAGTSGNAPLGIRTRSPVPRSATATPVRRSPQKSVRDSVVLQHDHGNSETTPPHASARPSHSLARSASPCSRRSRRAPWSWHP